MATRTPTQREDFSLRGSNPSDLAALSMRSLVVNVSALEEDYTYPLCLTGLASFPPDHSLFAIHLCCQPRCAAAQATLRG